MLRKKFSYLEVGHILLIFAVGQKVLKGVIYAGLYGKLSVVKFHWSWSMQEQVMSVHIFPRV